MATLRLICPFCCEPTRLELTAPHGVRTPTIDDVRPVLSQLLARWKGLDQKQVPIVLEGHFRIFQSLAHCPECTEYSLIKGVAYGDAGTLGNSPGQDCSDKVTVLRHAPPPTTLLAPEVPADIAEVLVELDEDYRRGRNAGRVLAGCRSVLDKALATLDPSATGARSNRIDALSKSGKLTADIAEWAKRLWVDGNDGVHELSAAGHPVGEHIEFLKLFVEVAFVIPERIKKGQV